MHLCLAAAGLAAILLLARALAGRRALAAGAAFRRIALAICKQAEHEKKEQNEDNTPTLRGTSPTVTYFYHSLRKPFWRVGVACRMMIPRLSGFLV